ncbi:hypothetical protein LEP1GSC115_3334 [Leptospira interrogans serovar Australis str. 200703203]|uniref:Uncharacterized protein n=1 Tax=Leptospira interrogans serovar Australis str. 200703203 TaxID=1085541 RepID=N1UMA8_LEPIR|nr:hypothetical protein LEP1GSC115_3334 [Leptospira interrogans serovar Australis str. 200703203]
MLLVLTEKPEEIRKEILLGMGRWISLKPEETFLLSSSKIRNRGFWSCIEWKIPRILERSELLQLRETFAKKNTDLIQVNRLLDPKEKVFSRLIWILL